MKDIIINIINGVKDFFLKYRKGKVITGFIGLNALILAPYYILKLTYTINNTANQFVIEIAQGAFDIYMIIALSIVNIPFVIWIITNFPITVPNRKQNKKIEIGYYIENDTNSITPVFSRKLITCRHRENEAKSRKKDIDFLSTGIAGLTGSLDAYFAKIHADNYVKATDIKIIRGYLYQSYYPVRFFLHNKGESSLKNIILFISFGEDVDEIKRVKEKSVIFGEIFDPGSPTYINEDKKYVRWSNNDHVLVGGLQIVTDEVFIKPKHPANEITAIINLYSEDFKQEKIIKIPVNYTYQEKNEVKYLDAGESLTPDKTEIEELVEYITS